MYGKWLFKEIKTEYGQCKVEIYRKNYTGAEIEMEAIESNSITLSLENLDTITAPIGKSVCSFSIIDTNQLDYDDFFSPDATAYKVVVSTRVGEGAYVTRWSGYITPDFFAENLSYRTPISISARDNIGYLNDVDFDYADKTITVRQLIQEAFKRIADDYPMEVVFASQKQTADGMLALDATISTILLREGTWHDALEGVLHDLGMQMRWVDNNTIAVLDLSQIPEYYAVQGFNFVGGSGYREILPAWRQLTQKQDYGIRDNFFEGGLEIGKLEFVREESIMLPLPQWSSMVMGAETMRYYTPTNWITSGNTFTINPNDYHYIDNIEQNDREEFNGRIYFTGVESENTDYKNYMSWRQKVTKSGFGTQCKITFRAFTSLMANNGTAGTRFLEVYDPTEYWEGLGGFWTGDYIRLGLKINVLLHTGTDTYILEDSWAKLRGEETNSIKFVLDKMGDLHDEDQDTYPKEQEISIDLKSVPYSGEIELRIYGFTIEEKKNTQEDGLSSVRYDWLRMVSYITDVSYSFDTSLIPSGQESRTQIGELHNVKETQDYSFGQVVAEQGGINTFAGGLYDANNEMQALIGFQRNAEGTNYNLLELVGREIIHYNKRNYNKLSGTIRNLAKEPLMFNRLFEYKGKKYAPFAYSLNVISNEMNITTMQEVEDYTTEQFSEINSAVITGGATVGGGGNNTILQYSHDAGNTKRIYELTPAASDEVKDAWVMLDNPAFPEAKRVSASSLGLWRYDPVLNALVTNANLIVGGTLTFGGDELPESPEATGGLQKVTIRFEGSTVTYESDLNGNITLPAYPSGGGGEGGLSQVTVRVNGVDYTSVNGLVELPNYPSLNGYATQSWVGANYLGLGGGTINGTTFCPLHINTSNSNNEVGLRLQINGTSKMSIGWDSLNGIYLYNYSNSAYLGVKDDATPYYYNGQYYTLLHSNNYSSYALPLSGGTIKGGGSGILTINRTSGNPLITFQANGTNAGFLGFNTLGNPIYVDATTYADYTLYHTGNFNPSNYLPLSGGTIKGTGAGLLTINRTNGNPLIEYQNNGSFVGYIGVNASGSPIFADNNGSYNIIHSGNIGSYNAGSATKLQTARSIWGQSFDGTGNVTGNVILGAKNSAVYGYSGTANYNIIDAYTDAKQLLIGYGSSQLGHDTIISGSAVIFTYGSNRTEGVRLNSAGNLLVGAVSDGGSGAKLQVAGNLTVSGGATFGGDVQISGDLAFASDARLKDNITTVTAEESISILRQLRPASWSWKKDGNRSYGLIAQEVAPILPDMITEGAHLHLQYNHLHAFEIGAIQYIDTEVETLKKDLEVANNRIEALENELKLYRRVM